MSEFKVGDKVRIRLDASAATDDSFIENMKNTPGMVGVVEDADPGGSCDVRLENGDSWWYAAQSLEAA